MILILGTAITRNVFVVTVVYEGRFSKIGDFVCWKEVPLATMKD